MKNPVDKRSEMPQKGRPTPPHRNSPRPPPPAASASNHIQGQLFWGGDVTAFRFDQPKQRKLSLTVRELLGLVKSDYDAEGKRSRDNIRYPMRHVIDFFGEGRRARSVTEADLQSYVVQRRDTENAAPASIKVELAMLRRGYRLALRAKLPSLTPNDVPTFPTIRADQLGVRRGFLRSEQVFRLLPYLETDVADLVHFLFATAWRVSEAQGLTWPQVDATHIVLATSKSGQARKIPIAGEIIEALGPDSVLHVIDPVPGFDPSEHERDLPGQYVFHRAGKQISSFRHQWRRALRAAGLDGYLVHDLRRSAILRMIESGADQKAAMEWSGHKTDTVFRRYLIIDDRRMVEVAERVAEMEREKTRQARADRAWGDSAVKWRERR